MNPIIACMVGFTFGIIMGTGSTIAHYYFDEPSDEPIEPKEYTCAQCYEPFNQILERAPGNEDPAIFINPGCVCGGAPIDVQLVFIKDNRQQIITQPVPDQGSSSCDIVVPFRGERFSVLRYYGKPGCDKVNYDD